MIIEMVSYLSNYSPLKFIEIRPARFLISYLMTFFFTLKRRCYTLVLWSASRMTIYAFQAQWSTSTFGRASEYVGVTTTAKK